MRAISPALAAGLLCLPLSHAGVVATDAAVPALMNNGGTEPDPAQYIIGNAGAVTVDYESGLLTVGDTTPYNQLIVRNGATAIHKGMDIGDAASADNNLVRIEGAGSRMIRPTNATSGSGRVRVGSAFSGSTGNLLHIRDGGEMVAQGLSMGYFSSQQNVCLIETGGSFSTEGPYIGAAAVYVGQGADDCSLIIRDAGTSFTALGNNNTVFLGDGSSSDGNSIEVANGADFSCSFLNCGGNGATNGTVTVSGSNSVVTTDDLIVADKLGTGAGGTGNVLLVENNAMVIVNRNSTGSFQGLKINNRDAIGNLLRIKGGFLAWNGDHVSDVAALVDEIEVWNGTAYETANGSAFFDVAYFTDETAAKAATASGGFAGYDGLGGYTLLRNVTGTPPTVPDIAIVQNPGTDLADGVQVAFGTVADGASNMLSFTLSNTGSADLTGLATSLSGPDAAQFALTSAPAGPVAPEGNTSFTLEFTPTGALGPRNAVLSIASNDPDENPFTLILTGDLGIPSGDRTPVGDVSGGSVTAGSGEALDIGTAVGGDIDATAGTAFLTSLDGANLQVGNLGAFIENLLSGNVDAEGNVTIENLADGNVTIGQLAKLFAEQGNFLGTLSGTGELVKTGDGNLTLGLQSAFQGKVGIWGGVLTIAALGDLGTVPIIVLNNGRFRVLANLPVSEVQSSGGTYEKVFAPGEPLENFGCFVNGQNTCMTLGAGTAPDTSLEAAWLDDVLSLDGLDGTTFLLSMDAIIPQNLGLVASDIYIGWKDPADEIWKRAGVGNHGPDGSLAGFHTMPYLDFLSANGGWNPVTMLGAYGTDLATGQVWAVVDHNSEFSLRGIPEEAVIPLPEIALHNGSTTSAPQLFAGQSTIVQFGTTDQGIPIARDFTISNPGDGDLSISNITGPADFTILNAPTTVTSATSATFQVRYDAASPGIHSGIVTINSDDPDESTFTFPVRAAVAPVFVDTDGDGMSDAFEDLYGLDKNLPADAALDDDHDGISAFGEFAFFGNPQDSGNPGIRLIRLQDTPADPDTNPELTLTLAVRRGLTFSTAPDGAATASGHGIDYRIEGSLDLTNFTSPVTAGAPTDFPPPASALPDLTGTLWEYRTFSLNASNSLQNTGFLRPMAAPQPNTP